MSYGEKTVSSRSPTSRHDPDLWKDDTRLTVGLDGHFVDVEMEMGLLLKRLLLVINKSREPDEEFGSLAGEIDDAYIQLKIWGTSVDIGSWESNDSTKLSGNSLIELARRILRTVLEHTRTAMHILEQIVVYHSHGFSKRYDTLPIKSPRLRHPIPRDSDDRKELHRLVNIVSSLVQKLLRMTGRLEIEVENLLGKKSKENQLNITQPASSDTEIKLSAREKRRLSLDSTSTTDSNSTKSGGMAGQGISLHTLNKEFFVKAVKSVLDTKCYTIGLRDQLLNGAVKKDGNVRNQSEDNLLFPPSVIRNVLRRDEVMKILACKCRFCRSVSGRDLLSDALLVDAVTSEEGDHQRRHFAVLVFMGAGFAARHVCSFHTRGLHIASEESILRLELFKPLLVKNVFPINEPLNAKLASVDNNPGDHDVAKMFVAVFRKTEELFDSPKLSRASSVANYTRRNLPFLNEKPLNTTSPFGSLFSFHIHQEFSSDKFPTELVRKELNWNDSADEDRRTLEYFARCGRPNLIQLLFWYRDADKINYVFPRYPGNLQSVLGGDLARKISYQNPEQYGLQLKSWLWQGIVDVIAALTFFHNPEPTISPGLAAGHFNLEPANVLVDESGGFIITGFGESRTKDSNQYRTDAFTSAGRNSSYCPPPLLLRRQLSPNSHPILSSRDEVSRRDQSYDVWSMACIITETIECITNPGPDAFRSFQNLRLIDDKSSAAFWMRGLGFEYQLRPSVCATLKRFRTFHDQYLDMVVDLLDKMFSIDAMDRPTMSDCLQVISQNTAPDDWPFVDDNEMLICGLGTTPKLHNMRTRFQRKNDEARRCKMYLFKNTPTQRLRVSISYEKNVDSSKSKTTCLVSDSARQQEEEFKLVSLFKQDYVHAQGIKLLCAFGVVHPDITFVFDDPNIALKEYYHFLTAVTQQESVTAHKYIPISRCKMKRYQFKPKEETILDGHLQIWRQLSDQAYQDQFVSSPDLQKASTTYTRSSVESQRQEPPLSSLIKSALSTTGLPRSLSSSGSKSLFSNQAGARRTSITSNDSIPFSEADIYSASTTRLFQGWGSTSSNRISRNQVDLYRMVLCFPQTNRGHARCFTINLTNGYNKVIFGRNGEGKRDKNCVTIEGTRAGFSIGNFGGHKTPGIPIDPISFAAREDKKKGKNVDWVELEFKDEQARTTFNEIWKEVFPSHSILG